MKLNKKIYTHIGIITIIIVSLSSCASEKNMIDDNQDTEFTISGLNTNEWTYISILSGKSVGKSALGNKEEDEIWRNRNDWDFAICGRMIRTNSGTSGNANGGIERIDYKDYNEVTTSDANALQVDSYIK